MEIKNLIIEEVTDEMTHLGAIEVGTDKYKTAVDGITKLVDKVIEIENLEKEKEKSKIEKLNTIAGHVINGVKVGSNIVLILWGTQKILKFELEGTVTSLIGRGIVHNFLPKL